MRTMLKMTIPVEQGNRAVKDGSIQKILQSFFDELKPEASYFYAENGQRTALLVFDMKDTSQIPALVEPLFMGLNAKVDLYPVMNADDLKAGLEQASKGMEKELAGYR